MHSRPRSISRHRRAQGPAWQCRSTFGAEATRWWSHQSPPPICVSHRHGTIPDWISNSMLLKIIIYTSAVLLDDLCCCYQRMFTSPVMEKQQAKAETTEDVPLYNYSFFDEGFRSSRKLLLPVLLLPLVFTSLSMWGCLSL